MRNVRNFILGALLCVSLPACIPYYPYEPWPPRATAALGEMRENYAALRVFYATDRNTTGFFQPVLMYGNDRGVPQYGQCEVSIPRAHGRGRLEEAPLFLARKPEKHVALTKVTPAGPSRSFMEELREKINASPRKQALVFVHGYNVSFEDAVRRTGQLAHDANFDGVAIAYSWPASESLWGYLIDETNVEWTEPHLVQFLSELVRAAGAERIHLMAHSMGNRLLSRALKEIVRQRSAPREPEFDQVILAAADIDGEIFKRDFAPYLIQCARRVTIYASTEDWAITGSRKLHYYPRLGEVNERTDFFQDMPAIEVIDASPITKGLIGHFYYGDSPTMLADLGQVLLGEAPAARRLKPSGTVYRIEP